MIKNILAQITAERMLVNSRRAKNRTEARRLVRRLAAGTEGPIQVRGGRLVWDTEIKDFVFEPEGEEAERRERAARRAAYTMRLNCKGKAAADAHTGEDLSDVDEGLYCGLRHLGACNREGADFDAADFDAL